MMDEKRAQQIATIECCEILEKIIQGIHNLDKMVTTQCHKDIEAWQEAGTDDGESLPDYAAFYLSDIRLDKTEIINEIAKALGDYIEHYAGPNTEIGKQANEIRTLFLSLYPANRADSPSNEDETYRTASKVVFDNLQECLVDGYDPDSWRETENGRQCFMTAYIGPEDTLVYIRTAMEDLQKAIVWKCFFGSEQKMSEVLRDLISIHE